MKFIEKYLNNLMALSQSIICVPKRFSGERTMILSGWWTDLNNKKMEVI